jgi:hypothetical protein
MSENGQINYILFPDRRLFTQSLQTGSLMGICNDA